MNKARKTVFYCDDQKIFIDKFKEKHSSDFDIISTTDASGYKNLIVEKMNSGIKPDLILIDLYHPNLREDFDKNFEEAQEKLEELKDKIEEIRLFIEKTWIPIGIDVLTELRKEKKLNSVPIMFYTQRGLLFMDDDQLKTIYENNCDWILKDKRQSSRIAERERMHQVIRNHEKENNFVKRWLYTAYGMLVGIILGYIGSILANFTTG